MAQFGTTNPHYQFHAVTSKEHMMLLNGAITNFKPQREFKLEASDADAFANAIETQGHHYAFIGLTARVATECVIDAADPNNITFSERKDVVATWNVITEEVIQKNATMLFGNKTWAVTPDNSKDLMLPTAIRGELTQHAANLTAAGKQMMHKRFLSACLGHQCLQMIGEDGRKMLKVMKHKYEWFNDETGEICYDGLMILFLILQRMRPSVIVSAFNEIKKMKTIVPGQFGHNISKWDTAMESGRITIELKAPGQYTSDQYMNDYLQAALEVPCKSFKREVGSIKTTWQLGTDVSLDRDRIRHLTTQMYINFENDGTWKAELAESSQIIALSTKIDQLENRLTNTIALATYGPATTPSGPSPGNGFTPKTGQVKKPYTVKPWRLECKGETCINGSNTWFWCKGDHYSNATKYNGMYCTHKTEDHDAWRKALDDEKAKKNGDKKVSFAPATGEAPTEPAQKRLALSEKLRTALTTQCSLTPEAYSQIWEDACRDSGNA